MVGEVYKRKSFKETAKARLAAAVALELFAQVEDIINNKEEELDEQYTAIKIDYKAEVIVRHNIGSFQ